MKLDYEKRAWAVCVLSIFLVLSESIFFVAAQEADPFADTDGDGLTDWDEVNRYGSRPDLVDTDGDTINDGVEVGLGMSPLTTDSDGDSYSDNYEYTNWNPDAPRVEDRYRLCPYIANLPDLKVEVVGTSVRHDFIFVRGQESKSESLTTQISQLGFQTSWGASMSFKHEMWSKSYARMGLMSQDLGWEIEAKAMASGSGAAINMAVPQPYLEVMQEVGTGFSLENMMFLSSEGAILHTREWEGSRLFNSYTQKGWDLDSANLLANVSITNSYDRTVLLSKVIFDLGIGDIVYQTETGDIEDITIGLGQSYTFQINFPIGAGVGTGGGQEWIYELAHKPSMLSIRDNYQDISLWDDTAAIPQWVSIDVVMERVQTQCALVEVVGPDMTVKKFVTANVDRIDGLNVLDALDMLYIPYTYKYGRMLDLMGVRSTPGEKVWAFAYWDIWYDPETISNEVNFEKLNMWGRGALTVDLQTDTDGDWLTDSMEFRIGTNATDPDTDHDFADDFVEVAFTRSNPFVDDTDGGGTLDGIEYYEHLNLSDPNDDKFELPEWYINHETIQTAQEAAELLLKNAIVPEEGQLTWPATQSPALNVTHSYQGDVTYVINETLAEFEDESVQCIAIGDADNDGQNETAVGTSPFGIVYLIDNEMIVTLGNFSDMYDAFPVSVMDIAIGDVDNSGGNMIVVGTQYFDGEYTGDLYTFEKTGSVWYNNSIGTVTGGVYSLAIGNVNYDAPDENELVVGTYLENSGGVHNGSVIVYTASGTEWSSELAAITNSSSVYVTINEYEDSHNDIDYPGKEIVWCTYSYNSTLGWIGYDYIGHRPDGMVDPNYKGFDNFTVYTFTSFEGDPDWEKFLWIGFGNSKDEETELIAAIEMEGPDNDYIKVWGTSRFISENLHFPDALDELIFEDIDNDGLDEIVFINSNVSSLPNTDLMVWDYNGSLYVKYLIESPVDHISCLSVGDTNSDDEIEFIYGTDTQGLVKLWSLPEGALWYGEKMEWKCNITLLEPWIYQGQRFPVEVNVDNYGDYNINNLSIYLNHNKQVNNQTDSSIVVNNVTVDRNETLSFDLWPISNGNFSLEIYLESRDPRVSHYSLYYIPVRSRSAYQAEIGQALLDLAIATENETLLEAAKQVGNWLASERIEVGRRSVLSYHPLDGFTVFGSDVCAWNGDANYTEGVLPGNILTTAKTGQFLLNLYNATLEYDPYLDTALRAADYLANCSMFLQMEPYPVCATSWTPESLVEVAEIGRFLLDINQYLIYDFYDFTVKGLANYLCIIAGDVAPDNNWLGEPKLTQEAASFLARLQPAYGFNYTGYALGAGTWLSDYGETNAHELSTCFRTDELYLYYNDTGLAGLGITLGDIWTIFESDYDSAMKAIGNELFVSSYMSAMGRNWREPYWTTDIEKLVKSANWDYGASGIAVSLADVYKVTGNQTYRESFLEASEWLRNCIHAFDTAADFTDYKVCADVIRSMVYVHSVLPVIKVGYFVDPMTSLSGLKFVLSGYVQTIGWHANQINLTVDFPAAFLLPEDQNESIFVGTVTKPGAKVVTWDVYLRVYGEFELTIEGESANAGNQTNTARLTVTDLGVEKIGDIPEPAEYLAAFSKLNRGFCALSVPEELSETLYNLGEQILLPIEALYNHTGGPAYNASISVGDYGTAVVNGSGLAYLVIQDWEPGVKDIPITIRYDKNSGITDGISNLTLTLTFSSLEVTELAVSSNVAQIGEQVTFTGKVCYGHDGSPVAGATVALNGSLKTVTDSEGYFTFEHTETTTGAFGYEISATADGDNRIIISSLNQTIHVEWEGFWTPISTIVVIGGAAAVVVILVITLKRLKGRPAVPSS